MALQVIIGFDNSASMQSREGNTSRIALAKELAGAVIAKACQVDPDGPDVFAFGQTITSLGNITAEEATAKLQELRASEYATNFGAFLTTAFSKAKAMISGGDDVLILVFTDGAATDASIVQREIVDMSNWMAADSQCALEIVYFGDEAKSYLQSLDDELTTKGAKFDIVDCTPIAEAQGLDVEALLNKAFND